MSHFESFKSSDFKVIPDWFMRNWETSALVPLRYSAVDQFQRTSRTRRSQHEHYCFLAVLSGKGVVRFPNRSETVLSRGDLFMIPPHCPFNRHTPEDWSWSMIDIQAHFVPMAAGFQDPYAQLKLPVVVRHPNSRRLAELGRMLEDAPTTQAQVKGSRLLANAVLQELLCVFLLIGFEEKLLEERESIPSWLSKVRHRIESDFKNPNLSVHLLASYGEISPAHLNRSFRKYLNRTVLEFIHQTRIHNACRFLSGNPEIKVDALAQRCGYRDRSVFYRQFRKVTGVTPRAFR